MTNKGYILLNHDLTKDQIDFINEYAETFKVKDKNVLKITGDNHYIALNDIINYLYNNIIVSSLNYENELTNHGDIVILNDYDSFVYDHVLRVILALPTNTSSIIDKQLEQLEAFKNYWNNYDSVIIVGELPDVIDTDFLFDYNYIEKETNLNLISQYIIEIKKINTKVKKKR